ncbi:Binding partner of ACD11 1 [Vitis vinifera]|uniref:Binding partner of ACD11 1 n=1 Tax=Vitis vinifera TaxID=29760 RepID=A0A438GH28_VITVI|nr:Binding partner of ACD11 1 [Vitis vinifera]
MKRDKSLFVSAQTVRIKPVPVSLRPEAEEKTGAEGDSSSALGTPTPRFYLFVTSRISNFNANAATHLYSMELLATQMLRRLCRINFLTLFPPPIPHQLHFVCQLWQGNRFSDSLFLKVAYQVLDISPKVTLSDLNIFFSYCGTVDNIQLCRKNDQTQLAFVTFKQPYAFQTALLLNGAVIGDSPIRILALQNLAIHPIPDKRNCETRLGIHQQSDRAINISLCMMVEGVNLRQTASLHHKVLCVYIRLLIGNKEKQGIFPVVNSAIQGIASKSMEMFNKTADELEENCKLSEKGRALMHQTRLAICAAEKGAGQLGTAIMNNEYVSNGSIWLSGVVDRASKYATARKQK